MKVRGEQILIPTSMVGNYPNPRWWDASWGRHFTGNQEPPDSMNREALEDVAGAIVLDQENAGLDIISDGRVHGDNYADAALYYYLRRLGYDLKGGHLGFPIYSRPRALAIAKAMNQDILEVDALGVDFIQLDEFTWPYFYEDWAIEAFNVAVAGVKRAKIIVHVCWGNWGGTPAYFPDETAKAGEIFDLTKRKSDASPPPATRSVVPKCYGAHIDVLNLESCGRRDDDLSGLDAFK